MRRQAGVGLCVATTLMGLAAVAAFSHGDSLALGETVLVKLDARGAVVVGFFVCDARACSKVEAWLQDPTKTSFLFKMFVDCNTEGYGGTETGQVNLPYEGSRSWPRTFLLAVSRRTERQLAVWVHGSPASIATVALSPGQRQIRVERHWMESISPGAVTITFVDTNDLEQCANGGELDHSSKICSCPPGFGGKSCEIGCGPDHRDCQTRCSNSPRGCRQMHFGWKDSPAGVICGAGLRGSLCDQMCMPGTYGAGCLQPCGRCASEVACDQYTGKCPLGCLPGYSGPNCQQELTHMTVGPAITTVTETSFSGFIWPSPKNTSGSGDVRYYDVQYKVDAAGGEGGDWKSGSLSPVHAASTSPTPFSVDGLCPGLALDVRVVLRDASFAGFTNVPQVRVVTRGTRRVADLIAIERSPTEYTIAWALTPDREFVVRCECVEVLGCTQSCSSLDSLMVVQVNSKRHNAELRNLQPGTVYRVTVAPKNLESSHCSDSITFTTPFQVPGAPPEIVRIFENDSPVNVNPGQPVTLSGSSSAVVQWREPDSCLALNGPLNGFRWQLLRRDANCGYRCLPKNSTTTFSTSVRLASWDPDTAYELRVYVVNILGLNPEQYLSVTFVTK